jgi:prevent-host-death family protein
MYRKDMTMLDVNIVKARESLAELLNRVAFGGERVSLKRRGKRVAVIVSAEDAELLEELEDHIDLEAAKKALKDKKRIPFDQVRKELGLK